MKVPIVFCDALPKFRQAECIGIAKGASIERTLRGLPHKPRGGRARLANLHMDDVAASSLRRVRFPHHVHDDKGVDRAPQRGRQRGTLKAARNGGSSLGHDLCCKFRCKVPYRRHPAFATRRYFCVILTPDFQSLLLPKTSPWGDARTLVARQRQKRGFAPKVTGHLGEKTPLPRYGFCDDTPNFMASNSSVGLDG